MVARVGFDVDICALIMEFGSAVLVIVLIDWEAVSVMMSEPSWGMSGGGERLVMGSSVRLV